MKRNSLACPIGTFPGNRNRSLLSNCVEVSIATEQLVCHRTASIPRTTGSTEFAQANHLRKQ